MKTVVKSLHTIFNRDINKLEEEIRLYTDESDIWVLRGTIKNTAGNLALHLCGNLQHFVGAVLGGTDYKRDREHEFAARNIEREKLLAEIVQTRKVVLDMLEKLAEESLGSNYPQEVFGYPMTTAYFLIHLSGHLMYHLGQINYHRRMVE